MAVELKKLVRVPLAVALTGGVVAALLWFGDARKVVAVMEGFQRIYLLAFLLLILAHEVVRGLLWHILLHALQIRVPLRAQVFAFAVGEAAKAMPTGTYLQNYILQRSRGVDFGRSSSATTMIVVSEIVAALAGIVILGVGAWTSWLRPLILVGTAIVAAIVWAYLSWPHTRRAPQWVPRHRILRRALREVREFREGAAELLQPRILTITLLLSAVYVLIAGASLYVVVLALSIGGVSFWQVVAVNCFGLAFYVVVGSIEAADVGAFVVIGVGRSAAVSAILVNRVLNVAATGALASVVVAALHDELRAALHGRPGAAPQSLPGPQATSSEARTEVHADCVE